VFFEEWDDPLISGVAWVSELVEITSGIDIFADLIPASGDPQMW
jgi:iron complex transport system substrate-binding protein